MDDKRGFLKCVICKVDEQKFFCWVSHFCDGDVLSNVLCCALFWMMIVSNVVCVLLSRGGWKGVWMLAQIVWNVVKA